MTHVVLFASTAGQETHETVRLRPDSGETASDVSKVVIPEKYRKSDDVLALAEQFAAQFECALEWASPAERDPEHALGGSAF